MNTRAPTRPTELHSRRVRLTTGQAAAAEARSQVQAAIRAWDIPVDPTVAILLTSELVTNAIRHEAGETITLAITCSCGQLRVDVHDTSCFFPVLGDASVDEETGRGLMLVDTLAAKWGCYRTPAGKAVYFTLTFQPVRRGRRTGSPAGSRAGAVEPGCPRRLTARTERARDRRGDHLDAMVRRADSRAMSVRECTSSFFRMCDTWVPTVRRESMQPGGDLRVGQSFFHECGDLGLGRRQAVPPTSPPAGAWPAARAGIPWARNAACSRATSAAAPRERCRPRPPG